MNVSCSRYPNRSDSVSDALLTDVPLRYSKFLPLRLRRTLPARIQPDQRPQRFMASYFPRNRHGGQVDRSGGREEDGEEVGGVRGGGALEGS